MATKVTGYEYLYPAPLDGTYITVTQRFVPLLDGSSFTSDSVIYSSNSNITGLTERHGYEEITNEDRSIEVDRHPDGSYSIKKRYNYVYHAKKRFDPLFNRGYVFQINTEELIPGYRVYNTYTLCLGAGPRSIVCFPFNEVMNNYISDDIYNTIISRHNIVNSVRELLSDGNLLSVKTFSLANFIAEAGEIKNLASLHKQKASGKFLGFNFGVLPLIEDLKAMFDIVSNFQKKVDHWNQLADAKVKLNYHRSLPIKEVITNGQYIDDSIGYGHILYTYDVRFILMSKVAAYIMPEPLPESEYSALLKSLTGLDDFASIVWEAVPYSFLVDWFVNIGEIIGQLDYDFSVLKFRLLSAGISVNRIGAISVKAYYVSPDGAMRPLASNTENFDIYTRHPMDIDDYTNVNLSTSVSDIEFSNALSGFQGLLLSALVDQRIRK